MSAFLRAVQLRDLNRHEDAVELFHQHLAEFPNDAEGHAQLAVTQLDMAGERRKALESIDAAIGIEADNATYFACRSLILRRLDQPREALTAAETAIGLDPDHEVAWIAKAGALSGRSEWAAAQMAVEKALELEPDNPHAQNQLAVILRAQGNLDAADRGTGRRLERDPEDSMAHANAGWSALQRHEVRKAEEHFREALRLDSELEYARLGLRESFKARSGFYRLFLRWVFFLQKFSEGQRILIFVGIYLAFRFGRVILAQVHPVAVALLVGAYLVFVFSSFLASGVGHLLILKDRNARFALTRGEKLDGLFVGGGFILGFVLVILGLTVLPRGVAFIGGAMAIGAIPAAMVFENDSREGRLLFGGCMLFVYLTGGVCLVQDLRTGDPFAAPAGVMVGVAVLAAALSTWLSMVPRLHRGREE